MAIGALPLNKKILMNLHNTSLVTRNIILDKL